MRHSCLVFVAIWFALTAIGSSVTGVTSFTFTYPNLKIRHYNFKSETKSSLRMAQNFPVTDGSSKKRKRRPINLIHERDFFRQEARLESMESYVLVSTLTASMSFGCLVGFTPEAGHAATALVAKTVSFKMLYYKILCLAVQVFSGFSTLYGLHATIMFSLTILYGKSALGAERDIEYDKFLRRTLKVRVHAARCFSLSLGLFAILVVLVLMERTFWDRFSLPVAISGIFVLVQLYRDWKSLFRATELLKRD